MKKFKSIKEWTTCDYGKNSLTIILFVGIFGGPMEYMTPLIILSIMPILSIIGLILGAVWFYRKIKRI